MKKRQVSPSQVNRRTFLRGAASGAAALALARIRAAQAAGQNPFAYDVSAFEKTDPKLLKYREARRLTVPREGARRLTRLPSGRLLVAAGRSFCELDPADGALVQEIAVEGPARCSAAAPDGTLYLGVGDHVEVFAPDGRPTKTWDPPAKRSWISGLAVSEEAVFVADSGQRVIWKCRPDGQIAGRIGDRDKERDIPGFVLPSPYLDVEWAPDGLLRVNNPGRHRVEFYTPDGHLELAWGKPGMAIECFSGCCNPINLALLPDGTVVTCEKGLPRVKLHSPHGELLGVVAGVEMFPDNARTGAGDGFGDGVRASLDAVTDPEGRVYILDTVTRQIHVMEPLETT